MGELINLNSPRAIADADIPAEIARDSEVLAAMAAHAAAADPHTQYLLQSEGDARYRQSSVALTDGDIPAAIARDSEVAAALAVHTAATDPHPSLWGRITAAFLALTGGQRVLKNNPGVQDVSFLAPNNHLELATNNGSHPIIGFHRGGLSATALYHAGYGENSLRIRNADGFDGAIIHEGNIGYKNAGSVGGIKTALLRGVAAAVNTPTSIPLSNEIAVAKIVAIFATLIEPNGLQQNPFYRIAGGGGWFSETPHIAGINVVVPPVQASQLVGKPITVLIWYEYS